MKLATILLVSGIVAYMAATVPFGNLTVLPIILGLLIVFGLAYED